MPSLPLFAVLSSQTNRLQSLVIWGVLLATLGLLGLSIGSLWFDLGWIVDLSPVTRTSIVLSFLIIQLLAMLVTLINLKAQMRLPLPEKDTSLWLKPAHPPRREFLFLAAVGLMWLLTSLRILLGKPIEPATQGSFFAGLSAWGGLSITLLLLLSREGLKLFRLRPLLGLGTTTLLVAPDNDLHLIPLEAVERVKLKGDILTGKLLIQTEKKRFEVDCMPFSGKESAAFYAQLEGVVKER